MPPRRLLPFVPPCWFAPDATPERGTPGHRQGCIEPSKRRPAPAVAQRCSFDYWITRTRRPASTRSGHGAPVFTSDLRDQHVCCEHTRCPSPCDRLSRPRTTTGPPPHPTGISRQRTFPPTSKTPAGKGTGGMVPTFTLQPFDRVGAQLCPCNLATATPQTFTVASRVDTANRLKSYHTQPFDVRVRVAARPRSARFEPLDKLEKLSVAGSSRTPFCLASRARTIWQY